MRYSACGQDPPSSSGHRRKARKRRKRSLRVTPGRYSAARSAEAEYEPDLNQRVLRNLLGIRSPRDMAYVEQRELIMQIESAIVRFTPDHCSLRGISGCTSNGWVI